MGSHIVHTLHVPRLCSRLAWWWLLYSRNMSPCSQPITLSFADDNCCVLDWINTSIWWRFVRESRGFTWDLRCFGVFALRRMIASFGATCRSRLQTLSSSRPHHQSTLRKIPKDCRSHLHRSGSLKLRNGNTSLEMGLENVQVWQPMVAERPT